MNLSDGKGVIFVFYIKKISPMFSVTTVQLKKVIQIWKRVVLFGREFRKFVVEKLFGREFRKFVVEKRGDVYSTFLYPNEGS